MFLSCLVDILRVVVPKITSSLDVAEFSLVGVGGGGPAATAQREARMTVGFLVAPLFVIIEEAVDNRYGFIERAIEYFICSVGLWVVWQCWRVIKGFLLYILSLYFVIAIVMYYVPDSDNSCVDGPSPTVYVAMLPLLLRSRWVEIKTILAFGKDDDPVYEEHRPNNCCLSLPAFLFGIVQTLDIYTDCMFPIHAFCCNRHISPIFLRDYVPRHLEPTVNHLGFFGVVVICLLFGTVAMLWPIEQERGATTIALRTTYPAGIGGLAMLESIFASSMGGTGNFIFVDPMSTICLLMFRTLCLSVPLVTLQVILLDVMGPHMSTRGKESLTASILLSLICILCRAGMSLRMVLNCKKYSWLLMGLVLTVPVLLYLAGGGAIYVALIGTFTRLVQHFSHRVWSGAQ